MATTTLRLAACFALVVAMPGCLVSRVLGHLFEHQFEAPAPAPGARPEPVLTGPRDGGIRLVWIGHASMLVQLGDRTVLTDPVFTTTVGQLSKRLVEPGLRPDQLPPVDAVLVSHMHFDHLSLGSLDAIEGKVRRLFVPRGGVAYLPDYRFDIRELARHEAFEEDGLRITAVPVRHVGFRYGLDAAWMTQSFTGYVIEYRGQSVYFPGDTGYDQAAFEDTRRRFPHLDLALLPIAPIEPRSFMKANHMSPDEALRAFLDLGARTMIPVHFDTFVDSTDAQGDAPRLLDAAAKERGLAGRVRRLVHGERLSLAGGSLGP